MPIRSAKSHFGRLARFWGAPAAMLMPLLALAGGFPIAAETLGIGLRRWLTADLEPGQHLILWPSGWA